MPINDKKQFCIFFIQVDAYTWLLANLVSFDILTLCFSCADNQF